MTDPTRLTMTQQVAAPPERVYAAWTDVTLLATWWWPQLPDTTYALDPVEGGRFRFRSEAAGIGVHGVVLALDPPRRLELTWVWEDAGTDGPQERVVVDLVPRDDGTLVTVTHEVADAASVDGYRQGWGDCLVRLGGPPPRG